MAGTVCIPIDANLYAEFILRKNESVDVASWVEEIVRNYLDQTELESEIWSKDHIEKVHAKMDEDSEKTYGDPEGFYQWGDLFLWNGTQIRMKYKGKNYYASVQDEEIILEGFEGEAFSPSQLASKVGGGTSRNAWRDLWIRERGSKEWVLAYDLRRTAKLRQPITLEDF